MFEVRMIDLGKWSCWYEEKRVLEGVCGKEVEGGFFMFFWVD